MNSFMLPPAPNWYQTNAAVCAPDNTFIYAAHDAIVIIHPAPLDRPANIAIMPFAHNSKIVALALPPTWNATSKVVASIGEDKKVKVWNLMDRTCMHSHRQHASSKSHLVSVGFSGDHKILSVTEDGFIVEWKFTTNEFKTHQRLLGYRVTDVSAMSICPHAPHLVAFGLKSGLVLITEFKGLDKASIVYKLKSHDREVLHMAWCPSKLNVIPDETPKVHDEEENHPNEPATELAEDEHEEEHDAPTGGIKEEDGSHLQPEDDALAGDTKDEDITDAMPANGSHLHLEVEAEEVQQEAVIDTGPEAGNDPEDIVEDVVVEQHIESKQPQKKNPWVDLKHADDDEVTAEDEPPRKVDPDTDFLSECLALKAKISELQDCDLDDSTTSLPAEQEDTEINSPKLECCPKVEYVISPSEKPIVESKNTSPETSSAIGGNKSARTDLLLATVSRGGYICIWKAGSDGRIQKRLRLLPSRTNRYNHRQARPMNSNNLWITLNWITPETLLSSGQYGELNSWNVCEPTPKPKLITDDHYGKLFCIVSPFKVVDETDDQNCMKEDVHVWTIGKDRNILYTSLKLRSVVSCYPCFSCPVLVFAASPFAPRKIAMGMGDGHIRFWDMGKPQNQYIYIAESKLKLGQKITSLAWHPENEFMIAFGTDEGQVGVLHSGAVNKPPTYYCQNFHTPIFRMEWAPLEDADKTKIVLYICAEGAIGVYETDTVLRPKAITLPKDEYITHFAWKPDYSKLGVGCKSGSIYIVSPSLEVLTTIYYQTKAIGCMSWHPLATAEDEEQSPNHEWLGCSTSSGNSVIVFDFAKAGGSYSVQKLLVGEYMGHIKPVNTFMWSPYKNGHMVTVSEDGTAMIWNNGQLTGTFVNSSAGPLLAGMWSPLDEHFVITSGRECTVAVWDTREQPMRDQEVINADRVNRRKQITRCIANKSEMELASAENKKASTTNKPAFMGDIATRQSNLVTSLDDCRSLFEQMTGRATGSDNVILRLFGHPEHALEIIEEQKKVQRGRGKSKMCNYMSSWANDIGTTIRKAITDGNVTPFIISIAPMISHKLWKEALEAYVRQLTETANSDTIEIASYYLCLHKIDEAIDILAKRQMFREALVLAKFKKPDDTVLTKDLLQQWSKGSLETGRFELAAQCYVAMGEFEEAAKVLMKRSDSKSMELALDLAKHVNNVSLIDTIQFKCDQIIAAQPSDEVASTSTEEIKLQPIKEVALAESVALKEAKKILRQAAERQGKHANSDGSDKENVDAIRSDNKCDEYQMPKNDGERIIDSQDNTN